MNKVNIKNEGIKSNTIKRICKRNKVGDSPRFNACLNCPLCCGEEEFGAAICSIGYLDMGEQEIQVDEDIIELKDNIIVDEKLISFLVDNITEYKIYWAYKFDEKEDRIHELSWYKDIIDALEELADSDLVQDIIQNKTLENSPRVYQENKDWFMLVVENINRYTGKVEEKVLIEQYPDKDDARYVYHNNAVEKLFKKVLEDNND